MNEPFPDEGGDAALLLLQTMSPQHQQQEPPASAMQAIFCCMRCHMNALAEDMQLLCKLMNNSFVPEPSSLFPSVCYDMIVQADAKLQADTAAFMRTALYMYTIMEEGRHQFAYYRCPIHMIQEMVDFVDIFVATKVDPAIMGVPASIAILGHQVQLPDVTKNLGITREHALLLANTLRAMLHETMAVMMEESAIGGMPNNINTTTLVMQTLHQQQQQRKRPRRTPF
jgi:hypothetical protein